MTAPQGIVRVCQSSDTLAVQVEGWATMVQSVPLRRRVEKALTEGVTCVRLDLAPCQYLDSTFLGTLFLLKRSLSRHGGALCVEGLSPACLQLFKQMGVDTLFPPQPTQCSPPENWSVLDAGGDEVHALHRNVIQAHQELASMDGKIGATFRPVAQCLARECATDESPHTP